MDLTSLLLNGAGGAIIGPLLSQFLGGKNQSLLVRIISGIVGGVGAGYGADAAGINLGPGTMQIVQSLLEGGVGGGVLATLAGLMGGRKA